VASWTANDLDVLRDTSLPLAAVAEITGRTLASASHKASRLGVDRKTSGEFRGGRGLPKQRNGKPGWSDEELAMLADPELPLTEISRMTGRTYAAVRHKASLMGLAGIRDYWLTGSDHPHFRDGQSKYQRNWRGSEWPGVREGILERDGYTCQDGKEFIPSGVGLVVHHRIPYRLRPVNDPAWLVTLCTHHHLKRPEHWWKSVPPEVEDLLAIF
jgi:hypothetical protein